MTLPQMVMELRSLDAEADAQAFARARDDAFHRLGVR